MGEGPPARYVTSLFDALKRWPDRLAVLQGERRLTFGELRALTYRMARALEGQGIGRGDTVVHLTGNSPEVLALRLACHLLGCRLTGLDAQDAADRADCAQIASDSGAAALVVDGHGAGAATLPPGGPRVLSLGVSGVGRDLLDMAGAESDSGVPIRAREQDIALLPYSRGSTGPRRAAIHRFSTVDPTWRTPEEGELGHFAEGVKVLIADSLARAGGDVALELMRAGATIILTDGLDPGRLLRHVEELRVTSMFASSAVFEKIIDHEEFDRTDLSGLRYLPYGGGPISPERLRRAVESGLAPVLSQIYVSVEARAITLLRQADHQAALDGRPHLLRSVGRAAPEVDIEIRDATGTPVPTGAVGEVWLRAPHVMAGYWRRPEETSAALRDGWLRVGDLGRLDADGYLYLCGRAPR